MKFPLLTTLLWGLAFGSALFGCKNSDQPLARARAESKVVHDAGCPHQEGENCGKVAERPLSDDTGTVLYGAPLTLKNEVPLQAILDDPDKYHEGRVRVSGLVRRACSRKGCWMEVTPSSAQGAAGCRVTFKDYGFLVPTDSAGAHAEMDAEVQVTEVDARAVAHYESEGARFAKKSPDGSAREVRLVASGVRLTRAVAEDAPAL